MSSEFIPGWRRIVKRDQRTIYWKTESIKNGIRLGYRETNSTTTLGDFVSHMIRSRTWDTPLGRRVKKHEGLVVQGSNTSTSNLR